VFPAAPTDSGLKVNLTMAKASAPPATRVLLVDDHPMVRERLSEVIQAEPGFIVCGGADDRLPAMEAIAATRPNIVVVDLTLKTSSGFDLIKDIQTTWPEVGVLVVSMHDESLHAERALRAGARGYITKQEATRKIIAALQTIRDGELYLGDRTAKLIVERSSHNRRAAPGLSIDRLSDREFRVFELIGLGRSTREIAAELALNQRTVETYRARIKEKLDLKNANELLRNAIAWNQTGRIP